jgi:hypothetical protein
MLSVHEACVLVHGSVCLAARPSIMGGLFSLFSSTTLLSGHAAARDGAHAAAAHVPGCGRRRGLAGRAHVNDPVETTLDSPLHLNVKTLRNLAELPIEC